MPVPDRVGERALGRSSQRCHIGAQTPVTAAALVFNVAVVVLSKVLLAAVIPAPSTSQAATVSLTLFVLVLALKPVPAGTPPNRIA